MNGTNHNTAPKPAARPQPLIIILIIAIAASAAALHFSNKTIKHSKPPAADSIDQPNGPTYTRRILLSEHNPNLDTLVTPSHQYLSTTDGLAHRRIRLRTDDNGFIIPSYIHKRPDLTIVFLGDSTTECLFLDEKERLPYLAGRLIEQKHRIKINSINSGVGGNNALHSIDILINKILPLKPDAVALMHDINDLDTLLIQKTYWHTGELKSPIVLLHKLPPKKQKPARKPVYNPSMRNPILASFAAMLKTFIETARAHNITPILMTQPSRLTKNPGAVQLKHLHGITTDIDISYDDYRSLFDAINETTRQTAAQNNVPLIDLAAKIPPDKQHIYDAIHLNTAGAALAAQIISDNLHLTTLKQTPRQ